MIAGGGGTVIGRRFQYVVVFLDWWKARPPGEGATLPSAGRIF